MNNFEDDSSIYKPSAHSYKLSAFQIWLIFSGNELYCWLLSVNHWQWHHPTNGDYYITIQEQANRVKISVGFVEKKIIHDHLNIWKVSMQWVPHLLIPFQKEASYLFHVSGKPWKLIAQDETLVRHFHRDSSSSNNGNTVISNSSKKACVQHFSGTQQKPPEQPNEHTSTKLPHHTNRHMLLWLWNLSSIFMM